MKKKLLITLSILLLFFCIHLDSQTITHVLHYSVDNGLSENHVLYMLQDKTGMMWFGTYDGLNKFDGYTFRNYKGRSNQKYKLANYRIDRIKEDLNGHIWVQTNDGRIYRFDTSTELFLPVPQCLPEYHNFKAPLNRISVLSDGTVWLYNSDTGNENCFKIENTDTDQKIKVTHLTKNNSDLYSDKINKIYLDKNLNTWILTAKGVSFLKKGNQKPTQLFTENQNGNTYSICENKSECYIGGEHGRLRVYNKTKGTLNLIETPIKSNIFDIQQLNSRELFLLTNTSDFYIYNLANKKTENYCLTELKSNIVHSCYKDRNDNIWIDAENQGAIMFDTKSKKINYLTIETSKYVNSQSSIFYLIEDKFNTIWVQLRSGGFYKYNRILNKLECISAMQPNEESISHMVHNGITDMQGNLWLATYLQGVDKIVFEQSPFTFSKPYKAPVYTQKNEIRSVFQDSKGMLWIGSKKGLVYLYNHKKELLGYVGIDGKLNSKTPFDAPVYDIMEDHTGTLWLATRGKGLFRCSRKPDNTFTITNYQYDPEDIYSLTSNAVYSVFEDHLHRIWVGTFWGGLNLLDNETGQIRFISSRNKLLNFPTGECNKIRYITEDKQHQLYFCTTQGLLVSKPENNKPEKIVFKRFAHDTGNPLSMSGNDVHYILISSKGDLYLALIGGGINIVKGGLKLNYEPKFELLRNTDSMSSDLVYTFKEDKKGCLWMSAQTHILKYNPADSKFDIYKPFSSGNYFFDEAAVCKTREGELIYGTSDGFISFDPMTIHKSNYVPGICLTELEIFNKPVPVGDIGSPLKKTLNSTQELTLTHKQNTFSIEYAAIDYINPQAIQYAYMLEGFEKEWNYVGTQRKATYINLPKGKYVFRVKSTNSDGLWVNNEKSVVIIKEPSFWESGWGILFYIAMFILFTLIVVYVLFTFYRLRNEVAIEHRITNMKLRFFTDISHELRTPLTLIASPVENILRKEPLSDQVKQQLEIVQKNTSRMLRLINQILDFRKIQNDKMKLIVEETEIADYVNEICESFSKLAEEKRISLNVIDQSNGVRLWIDKDKFEKILFNLLSNAFKFSQYNQRIDVIIYEDIDNVSVTISDNGPGINIDKLKLLFERFESYAAKNVSNQLGSGIGLSLTKELIELHHAKIEVETESGKGTSFKVTFRKGKDYFGDNVEYVLEDAEKFIDSATETVQPENQMNPSKTVQLNGDEKTSERFSILIAEDNNELRSFLCSALVRQYEIYEAANGREAYEMAISYVPDLIISDIMMPDMDGITFARMVKQDLNTSHIPLILLTAKTDMETKLEAMQLCVDDYITKPFSLTYIEARIENLLKIREQLQNYFKSTLTSGVITISKPDVTNMDEIFIRKTMKYIEENYDNPDINIDDIAGFTGVSRSSFFKKIKSLTGLAPVDFVRDYRLQKAVQLIESGETRINQISFSVGITDTKYFSRCFRQKFGMNPSDYRRKMTKNEE